MRKLKLFFACLLVTLFSIGQVWAAVESVTISPTQALNDGGVDPITIACAKGDGTSNPAISSGQLRLYQAASGKTTGNTISFSSSYSITSIVFTFNGSYTASNGVFSEGDYDADSKTWSGSTNSLTLTVTGTTSGTRIYITNMVVFYETGGGTPTCSTPTFSPAAGSYEGTQNVTITSTTGATIYYTTDGSTPTTTSSVYSTAIPVAADMTIKAYAVKDSYNDSEVATAAYTITEGPDVTLDFTSNTEWGFPTSKQVDEGTYNDGTYTVKVAGSSGNGFNFNNGKLLLGKTGAYVILPEFDYPIEKIVCPGVSGASSAVTWNVFDGDDAVSTQVTGCTSDQTFEIENPEANKVYTIKVTGNANLQISKIKIYFGSAPAVNKPTISGDENFVGSTTVTISHADAEHIYYTTNGDDPTTSSTEYLAPFTVDADGTTTVKAIAVKGSDVSDPATKTFTKVEALESLAALLEATTSTETGYNVVISDWVVTGAISNRAWISNAENTKGILLYKSGHGFTAGKKLNGVVLGTKAKIYQGYPELTSLVSTEVTVSDAAEITPRETTLAAIVSGYNVEQGTLVKLENVTYAASTGFSDGINTVALSTQLYGPTMVDGATYNIIGVVRYDNGPVYSIMPRSVDDVEQISGGGLPEVDGLAALKAETTGASYLVNLTNAVVTLVSGNNAFIEDATAGALIFYSGHGLVAGDKLNGQYEVTTATYQGKFEITAMEAQTGAEKTSGAEIPVTTLTIAQLNANFAANESKRIKIVGANVTDAISGSDRNGSISDGAALAVYAGVASTITLAENDNVDIIGYPGFHNTDEQLTVWAQADITVNEKEDPELSYSPATLTIEEGDAWSAPTLNNPHSLAIASYVSSNEAVATVTDGGEIALAGGIGTAVITAHTDGDATYAAGNATYTITVNEAGVYSMSFDLTRASYDDAADAEVVWNSSVVTFTAQKGEGTKVTNYLAGNYSGTTLIEEVRFYAKNVLSFVPQTGVTITKVEWMSTAKGYATKLAAETWTNATVEVDGTNDKLVNITPSAAGEFSVTLTDAARATGITVYYQADAEKDKLTASIAIDDMNMAVGDDDILLSAIAATSNPNKKAISYAVTSGSEYVSITGEGAEAALHAIAEGTATVTATIPNDLGNYTGATTTFDIIVGAAPATLESIAISGDASVLEYTAGQHFDPTGLVVTGTYSDASSAPITTGIDWTFDPDPLTEGTTSVSVTAKVGEITSAAVVVNGLTVAAAPVPTSGNVVILAEYDSKFYAMTNSLASGALAGVEVEKDGSKIVVSSAEDKAAIQWTATVTDANTTFQDGEGKYLAHTGTGTNLMLADDAENWTFDSENGCYSAVSGRAFFYYSSGGVFKNYSISSNLGKTGYSGAPEVRVIDPEDIVVTSKVDPQLAYTPASDEITVGDAWSAPVLGYIEGFDGLAAISYESSNEAVATVTAGVIALAGGTGTATITATFGGNASYLAGSATYTVKVNPVIIPEDCDGSDDFSTIDKTVSPTGYASRTTTNGWQGANVMFKEVDDYMYWIINGKTTAVGVITSPELSDGIASLKIRYANTFSESNGVSFRVDIKQGEDVVKTYTVTKANSEVTQNTVYTEDIEDINVAGEFQIIITNLSPSNSTSNKDRLSIGRLCWENYSAPEPPTPTYETVRSGLECGRHYTVCLEKNVTAVKGATFWNLQYKNTANTEVYLVEETAPEAGKPYIFQATADKLEVVYGNETADSPVENGALRGTFEGIDADQFAALTGEVYLLIQNAIRPRTTGNYLAANRAYVRYDLLTTPSSANFAPGKNVKSMPMQPKVATGMENGELINGENGVQKVLINGQLFILRGDKMYDVTGRLVK